MIYVDRRIYSLNGFVPLATAYTDLPCLCGTGEIRHWLYLDRDFIGPAVCTGCKDLFTVYEHGNRFFLERMFPELAPRLPTIP